MSGNLDKALDEIIDSHKRRGRKVAKNAPRKVSKSLVNRHHHHPRGAVAPVGIRKAIVTMSKSNGMLEAAYSTKVNVEGLPRDIKEDAVREFFKTSIGSLQRVLLSYNERGNSTGMATLTFATAEKAREAVKKFNGAPIDGGKSKLRLNLIVDPTRKPLSARIAPINQERERTLRAVPVRREPPKKNLRAPSKKAAVAKASQRRKQRPQKKSLEQLDQEMADYFEESSK